MLKLLFGPPCSDLCGELIRRSAADGGRFFLIVPRHYSHECERRLCEVLGDGASKSAEVLSVDRLYTRVAGEVGGAAERFLDGAGRLLLAYSAAGRIAPSLKLYGGEVRKPEFLTEALKFIDELHSCRVEPRAIALAAERIGGDLGIKLGDLALIAESYAAELKRRGVPRDRADGLCGLLAGGWAEDKTFAFYGYTEFNEQEVEILRLLCHSRGVTVSLGCERALINPSLGEDDPLYTYARTAGRLRRLAESEGVGFEIEDLPFVDERPGELRFISHEHLADESARYSGERGAVRFAEERSVWSECERAAAFILETAREGGLRYRDFAVALPPGDEYLGALEAVFGSWDIPIFADSSDPVEGTPVISALEAALDILRSGFASEDVLRYLKSGLSPLSFENRCELENYCYTWRISGGRFLRDFEGSPRGFSAEIDDGDRRALERLNHSRRLIFEPFVRFRESIRPGEVYPAREILREFYRLLCDLRLDRRVSAAARRAASEGELKIAGEYEQLWGKVCDLMDEFCELAGNEVMKFDEFSQIFELLLGGVRIGTIPPSLDGVAVGELGRLRHRRPRALLILGARAGSFPPPSFSAGLLDDRDREELAALDVGLEPSSRKTPWRGTDAAVTAFSLPRERLYISWAPSGEGDSASPSPLVLRLCESLGAQVEPPSGVERLLCAESSALELALRAAGGGADGAAKAALAYFSEHGGHSELIESARRTAEGGRGPLGESAALALYGGRVRLTASQSDDFMSCAYKYFCRYGLHARPLRRAELDPMESGTLIHAVLENTVRRASESGLLDGEIGEREKASALEIAHDELRRYAGERLGSAAVESARVGRLFETIGEGLSRVVPSMMDEFAASSFRPVGFEAPFGMGCSELGALPLGEHGELRGIIDRIDAWSDGERRFFRVVDYKSGHKEFDYTDVFHGVSLQLPIYLRVLERKTADAESAGAFYFPVSAPFHSGERGESEDKVEADLRKQERRSGFYLDDPAVVEALEHGGGGRFLPSAAQYKLTRAQFDALGEFVERELRSTVERIVGGEIEAHPSVRLQKSACDYCDFAAACRFDSTCGHDLENYRFTKKPDDFWREIGGEENG